VQLQEGVYPLCDTLWLENSITLAGRGPKTVLRAEGRIEGAAIGTKLNCFPIFPASITIPAKGA